MNTIDRLDVGVFAAILALTAAIVITILGGDHAGVPLLEYSPRDGEAITAPIRLRFGQTMDLASVRRAFTIEPPTQGEFSQNGALITFRPTTNWQVGTRYTVTISSEAQSTSGRRVAGDLSFSFVPRAPRLAFLAPAIRTAEAVQPTNIYYINPFFEGDAPYPIQLTQLSDGVEAYAPHPEGTSIAYARSAPRGTGDLYLVEVDSSAVQQLTNCAVVEARCTAPDWSPDGTRLVYERIELSAAFDPADRDVPRAWLLALRDLSTAPLFNDSNRLGGTPKWSPDGTRIAVYDRNLAAVAVYRLSDGGRDILPTLDDSGEYAFAPNDARLVYPQLVMSVGRFTVELELVDLADPSRGVRRLSGEGGAVEDRQPQWTRDGRRLAITRRILDGTGIPSAQVYWLEAESGKVSPLLVDAEFFHGAISFDPSGRYLAMQRFNVNAPQPEPSVWVLDTESGRVWQVAQNAFLPRWLP
ncbi:MAG: hypothetical protein OHK0023_18360 [Anaerolineae bacterium]